MGRWHESTRAKFKHLRIGKETTAKHIERTYSKATPSHKKVQLKRTTPLEWRLELYACVNDKGEYYHYYHILSLVQSIHLFNHLLSLTNS